MGTMVSLTVFDPAPKETYLAAVKKIFDEYDKRFSLYLPTSELSRIARHELHLLDASEQLRDAYALALSWRDSTNGQFTPNRPDGVIDLSGIIKALAIHRAGELLIHSGESAWCVNVGGDVLTSGNDESGTPWVVGIVNPQNRAELLTTVPLSGSRRACATSGSAERGDHIWTTDANAPAFVQSTVLANDIVTADVLATAIIAGGHAALDRICATQDVDAMTVDQNGNIRMTPDFRNPNAVTR